jgi:hypothetical protein
MAVEYPTLVSVLNTDTFEEWRKKTNSMILHTEAGRQNIGDLGLLNTDSKVTIVNAINEVDSHADENTQTIGNLSLLKSDISAVDLVTAINNNYDWQKINTDSQIDKEVIDRKAADSEIQNELDLTQTSLGILSNGTFNSMTGSNYLGTATNLQGAVSLLDTTTKTKADLLDALIATVGSAASAKFNWADSTVNYLTVEPNGNANIKKNMVILDQRIKTNTDAQLANTTAVELNLIKIENIIASLGVDSVQGTMVPDSQNDYATSANVVTNIRLLDNEIRTLDDRLDGEIEIKLDALRADIEKRTKIEDVGTVSDLSDGLNGTTIIDAINIVYGLLKPIADDYNNNGGFVRRNKVGGDSMNNGLDINNGDLKVQGAAGTSRQISCTGDIVAYIGSVG